MRAIEVLIHTSRDVAMTIGGLQGRNRSHRGIGDCRQGRLRRAANTNGEEQRDEGKMIRRGANVCMGSV